MKVGRTFVICLICGALALVGSLVASGPSDAAPVTQEAKLQELSLTLEQRLESRRPALYYELLESDNPAQQALNADPDVQLMYIRESGVPVFYILENINAARTLSTDEVWPGGGAGFSLTGSATSLGELCEWDGGGVRTSHQEFGGRVTQMDSPSGTHYHSTHVAGTMIGAGVVSNAKGMSYQGTLAAYDWNSDDSEMASAAAAGMHVSNHSYGYGTGWYYNSSSGDWYWYGDISVSTVEDYGFGFYSPEAEAWDQIAYDAPYYTICKSAGNDRNDYPGAGVGHYYYDGGWVWGTDTRDPDGGTDGYDCVSWNGTAKNILSVGAVNDISGGWTDPSDVVMSSFSGWGPTDDGRIKPDIVANGVSLYSSMDGNDTDYYSLSGTSMSTPNLAGSLNLLVRHYEATHSGSTPLASTMKAVLIQTANEAGPDPGPDYMFGWGLMNTLGAAELIQDDSTTPGYIHEESLANGATDEYYITSDGLGPIRVSLAWTDPPGTPPSPSLNPTTSNLVNDLDLRLERVSPSTVYQPYVLNPSSPASAATTGDNYRDNSEQIYLASPGSGTYVVRVTHKGTLSSSQDYSLVMSLPEGTTDTEDPVVTVDQPDGGEYWAVDSFFDILWTATDNVGVTSVDILFSNDGGATYPHTIATGEANDGFFSWLADVDPTTQARVKVIAYDAAANSGEDESDADFTLYDGEPPVVTVIQPNGGEYYAVDSFFDIMWTATDNIGVTSIDILLSSDGGATYPHTIATGEVNDGIFSWLVDVAPTTQARIRIIAHDAATNIGADESDADFTLYDGEPPLVTVIEPNGGENWAVDSFFDIMWTATDNIGVTSIDIMLSSDGGATYPHTIATGEVNDGIFSWLVDVAPTTQARIRVIAHDAATNIGADESDADFTLYDGEPPVVTVIQPNGGEYYAVDSFFDIMWTATDNIGVTSIDIMLSSDGGATYPHTIATGETNDGIFSWLADVDPTTQARVRVIAHDAAANIGADESDADFTLYDGEPPLVTVIEPNGGENWAVDSFFDIMWTATDNIGVTSIDIMLSSDGGATYPHTIATGEVNDGIFSWLADVDPTTQARVRVIAHDAAANIGADESDADFTIYDGEPPVVTVIQPNGGEYWDIAITNPIMWTATDNMGVTSVDILLSSDGGATYPHVIASGEPNDGFFGWLPGVAPTTQARVKVIAHDAAANVGEDESNADFTLYDGQPPLVTVIQPNGGENWAVDSFFDIMWNATDNVGVTSIDILLSSDGGATYPHTIATGEVNDGIFSWLVDVAPTTQARVRVIAHDAAANVGADESDADFTISDGEPPEVTVIQPNGGENWDIDSFFDIMWDATDNVGVTSIDILLSSDGGATFPTTIATGEANDGIFNWHITQSAATTARIKVVAYDAGANSGEDVSDADFELYDPASGVDITPDVPGSAVITGNSPNPFTETTEIRFGIPADGQARLAVYDVSGREVGLLLDRALPAGYHSVEWRNSDRLSMGLYFVKLRTGAEEVTHKVVLSR